MALRIYFAASIRGGRADAPIYHRIVQILQKYGTVLTEHVGDLNMDESGTLESRHTLVIYTFINRRKYSFN